jgi:hypothetical protein
MFESSGAVAQVGPVVAAVAAGNSLALTDAALEACLHLLVRPFGVAVPKMPLKTFFALASVQKPRGGGGGYERLTSDGNSVSSLAAGLQKSAEFLRALYIFQGEGDTARGSDLWR